MRFNFNGMGSLSESPETVSTPPVELRDGSLDDAPVLAQLMYTEIPWGRLRNLGMGFLTVLHRALCTSPHAVCIVAVVNGRIVGYVAGVSHLGRFHKEFVRRHGLAAAFAILPHLFGRNRLAALLKGLTYRKDPRPEGPQSELLVFAVAREFSGRGIGGRILDTFMARLRSLGVDGVRIGTVAEGNEAAINVYGKFGFRVVDTHGFYGDSQVHVMEYLFEPPKP